MIKNLLATVAAAGLVFAPIAAQAGTRASDAGVSMNALSSLDRAASPVGAAELQDDGGIPVWLLILLFAGAGAGIILAVEGGEDNKSPGT